MADTFKRKKKEAREGRREGGEEREKGEREGGEGRLELGDKKGKKH